MKILLWILLIIQPLAGERYIIPSEPGYVGLFAEVSQYGVEAVLAHDYLSGALFYQAAVGDQVIYDGQYYRITELKTLPAGTDPGYGFDLIYPDAGGKLILQTCYQVTGWYFVIAEPLEQYDLAYDNQLALVRWRHVSYLPFVERQ